MTEFLRTMWKGTSKKVAANGNALDTTDIPAATTTSTTAKVEIKNEPIEQSTKAHPLPAALVATTMEAVKMKALYGERMTTLKTSNTQDSSTSASIVSVAAGKAQRAARRDMVNARRDKRKFISSSPFTSSAAISSPMMKVHSPMPSPSSSFYLSGTSTMSSSTSTISEKNKKQKTMKTEVFHPMSSSALHSSMENIDISSDEKLRAMEAQLENLDPNSKEAKKKRRLIRNRMSAQLHRERKKAYVGHLEEQLSEKEKELKKLKDQLSNLAKEKEEMKKRLGYIESNKSTILTKTPKVTTLPMELSKTPPESLPHVSPDIVIKKEQPAVLMSNEANNWDYCLENEDLTDDDVMMMNKTNDFLKDFTTTSCEPHSSTGTATIATTTTTTTTTSTSSNIPLQNELLQPAKKNIAMMMAVVFSVTFFGNSAPFFTVTQPTNGCNFSSMFGANPPKEFSQMNIASRIMASLENTSWKDFTDLSTWRANSTNAGSKTPLTSSDTSDTTDAESSTDVATDSSSCGSPESIDDCLEPSFENELIDDFVYPVEEEEEKDPLNVLLLGTEAEMNEMDIEMDTENDKYEDSALLYQEEQKTFYNPFQVENTSIGIYEKLTTLWQEKNQVLLTVTEGDEIVQRTIADMTAVKDSMAQSKDNHCSSEAALNEMMESLCLSEDQSVSFLYPMSAFAPEKRVIVSPSDEVFLEVSCQLNHDKHQQRLQRQQSLVDIEEASLVEGLQLGTHGISSLM